MHSSALETEATVNTTWISKYDPFYFDISLFSLTFVIWEVLESALSRTQIQTQRLQYKHGCFSFFWALHCLIKWHSSSSLLSKLSVCSRSNCFPFYCQWCICKTQQRHMQNDNELQIIQLLVSVSCQPEDWAGVPLSVSLSHRSSPK